MFCKLTRCFPTKSGETRGLHVKQRDRDADKDVLNARFPYVLPEGRGAKPAGEAAVRPRRRRRVGDALRPPAAPGAGAGPGPAALPAGGARLCPAAPLLQPLCLGAGPGRRRGGRSRAPGRGAAPCAGLAPGGVMPRPAGEALPRSGASPAARLGAQVERCRRTHRPTERASDPAELSPAPPREQPRPASPPRSARPGGAAAGSIAAGLPGDAAALRTKALYAVTAPGL